MSASQKPAEDRRSLSHLSRSTALVALGANLGEPLEILPRAAQALIGMEGVQRVWISRAYRTEPFETPTPQPDYWNAVCELETRLTPKALLDALHGIEARFGRDREREGHHGARRLDLDLLLHGDHRSTDPALRLPHPGLEERLFVLAPLCDLRPNLVLPSGRGALESSDLLRDQGQALIEAAELDLGLLLPMAQGGPGTKPEPLSVTTP